MNASTIISVAYAITAEAHTAMHAKGFVSSDQVRARIARETTSRVDGSHISKILRQEFGPSQNGYFHVC